MSGTTAVSLSGNHSSFTPFVRCWLQSKLQAIGKNSLNELTPQERKEILEKAENESSKIYLLCIVAAVGASAIAVLFFSGLAILGGLAIVGKAIFAGSKLIFPLSLGAGVSLGIIFAFKSRLPQLQAELHHHLIEPLRNELTSQR